MRWQLRGRSYLCLPYSIEPGVRQWEIWLVGVKRIGSAENLRAAKALAKHHSELNGVDA